MERLREYATSGKLLEGQKVTMLHDEIYLGENKLYSGTKSIIDDILFLSSTIATVLVYFECVCLVFQKYRVSFRQDKCHFLLDRVEYVGHDLFANGNCPA